MRGSDEIYHNIIIMHKNEVNGGKPKLEGKEESD